MVATGRLATGFAAALVIGTALVSGVEAREVVPFVDEYRPGTLVVHTAQRRLYFVKGDGTAIRYPVAVGKRGMQWTGMTQIEGKHYKPDWSPPWEVKRDKPHLPDLIRGGSPSNPMGIAALTLGDGEYAIHGTNRPGSIGTFASYGCIRMYNQDISDLYGRVSVGTPVFVLP